MNIRLFCSLCRSGKTDLLHDDGGREYYQCGVCKLIFVPPSQFLSLDAEKARYDLHRNSSEDPEYRKFLTPLFNAVIKHLPPGRAGLDFGSGPGPTLSCMFEEGGHRVTLYDFFYAKNPAVFMEEYDFITATEVVEHLHNPDREFVRLWACLRKGGWLGIMTRMPPEHKAFSEWYYKNDPTHVCFFSRETFIWLADIFNAEVTFGGDSIATFLKR